MPNSDEARATQAESPCAPAAAKASRTASALAAQGRRLRPKGTKRPLLQPLDISQEEDEDEEECDGDDSRAAKLVGGRCACVATSIGAAALAAIFLAAPLRLERRDAGRSVQYSCPASQQQSLNDQDGDLAEWYDEKNACIYANGGATLAAVMNGACTFDAWNHGYAAKKDDLRPWKETAYVPHVRSGDNIYESACGIGLNMMITAGECL